MTSWLVRSCVGVLLLAGFPVAGPHVAPAAAQTPGPVRVFVTTEDGGQDDELAARTQSVKDLVAALARNRKKFALASDEDSAELIVEVVDRALTVPRFVMGMGARPGQPPGERAPVRTVLLRVRVTRGEASVGLTNKNTPFDNPNGWKSAADDLAKQIEKWLAER